LKLPVAGHWAAGAFRLPFPVQPERNLLLTLPPRRLLTKSDCVKYVMQLRQSFRRELSGPVSARRILLRICANLHQIYTHLKSPTRADGLQRYLVALAK